MNVINKGKQILILYNLSVNENSKIYEVNMKILKKNILPVEYNFTLHNQF